MIHARHGLMAYLQDQRESVPAEWDFDFAECEDCDGRRIDADGFQCEACEGAGWIDEHGMPVRGVFA